MSTLYGRDGDGNYTIEFDSRWRYPRLLGFKPEESAYTELQQMWEQATGRTIPDTEKPSSSRFRG